jgi:hypothetical protein
MTKKKTNLDRLTSTPVRGENGKDLKESFLKSVGGKRISLGVNGGEVWNFGWIPPENITKEQEPYIQVALAAMPRFTISGTPNKNVYAEDKVNLTELWKHPTVVEANGSEFTGVHQITGSCVGAGGGNAWFTLACVEAVRVGDPELPKVPFWLLPYGRSRYYLGSKTPGEGSTGTTFARAAREDGVIPADTSGLPTFTRDDGWVWGRSAELKWSDGDSSDTMALLPKSRLHLVKTTAQCRNGDDVREAIVNGYPVTCASMYAHNGGKVQGDPACLLASRQGSWSHQMSILAWWLHPQHGELFWLHNQWGLRAHGICPTGMPRGGVWIKKSDVDWICRDEVYAFSQFQGFPAPEKPISWYL